MDARPPEKVSEMRIACPFCNEHLDVDPALGGTETNCPSCSGRFQIPVPTAIMENPYATPSHASEKEPGLRNAAVREFAGKKIAAGICGILLGGLGVHKFILGFNSAGTIMLSVYLICVFSGCLLIVPVVGAMAIQVVGLVEGILYLTKSDEEFYQTYAIERREWF